MSHWIRIFLVEVLHGQHLRSSEVLAANTLLLLLNQDIEWFLLAATQFNAFYNLCVASHSKNISLKLRISSLLRMRTESFLSTARLLIIIQISYLEAWNLDLSAPIYCFEVVFSIDTILNESTLRFFWLNDRVSVNRFDLKTKNLRIRAKI